MNALGVVVADTTPLNYLIVIDRAEILAALFGEVLIPEAVSVVRSAMRMGLLRPLRSSHIPRFYDRYAIRLRCVRTFPGWLSWPLAIWWA